VGTTLSIGLQPFRGIPGPPRLSILGSILKQVEFDRDPIRGMQHMRAQYGNLVRFETRFGYHMLFAFGPEYNGPLYSDTDLFHSRPFVLPGPKGSAQHRLRQSIFSLNKRAHHAVRATCDLAEEPVPAARVGQADGRPDLRLRQIRKWERVAEQHAEEPTYTAPG
jgi:hypothetical protein